MKVMICANLAKERSRKAAADACAKLNEIGFLPMIEKQYENIIKVDNAVYAETDSLITDCDMFMTIGGDGTILKWGQKAAACNKLLLGINTGRLGFSDFYRERRA
ncbi:MAG: NAD(+)/NADH kinase [[Eubacterium] siraeum]